MAHNTSKKLSLIKHFQKKNVLIEITIVVLVIGVTLGSTYIYITQLQNIDKTMSLYSSSTSTESTGNGLCSSTRRVLNNIFKKDTSTTKPIDQTTMTNNQKINSPKTNPLKGLTLFKPSSSGIESALEDGGNDALYIKEIYDQPRGIWLMGNNENIKANAHNEITESARTKSTPVFVLYYASRVPCSGQAEWANEMTAYLQWIKKFAEGTAGSHAIVILEPDALAMNSCIYDAELQNNALAQAVSILKNTNPMLYVYIDAGHVDWILEETMATRLKNANIYKADGFALNVSNFYSNEDNNRYGEELSNLLGGNIHFIIDTSRNGIGPTEDHEWCNPPERALGVNPTTITPYSLVDAFLWVKIPGESDEECNGGPSEGAFWKEYAVDLVKNRIKYIQN